jgi:hypothetical protein
VSEILEIARRVIERKAEYYFIFTDKWAGDIIALAEQVLADATRIAELERPRWPDGRPAAGVGLDELVCDCDPPERRIPEMSLDNEPEICQMLEDWHPPAVEVTL